jgi:hypothetical protein
MLFRLAGRPRHRRRPLTEPTFEECVEAFLDPVEAERLERRQRRRRRRSPAQVVRQNLRDLDEIMPDC